MKIEAFFHISYGLYIISTFHGGKKNGYVGNTVFQVTAEPAQIAISCSKDNLSCSMIEASGLFSFSILKQDVKQDIIGTFGYHTGREINKFENIKHIVTENSTPVVTEDCLAWFECKVIKQVDVGSHIIFISEVIDNDIIEKNGTPLTYSHYHKAKRGLAPKNAPTYIDQSVLTEEVTPKKIITPETQKYRCLACGYIYDPELGDEDAGIKPGTSFEDLPDDWVCPTCGSPKEMFEPLTD